LAHPGQTSSGSSGGYVSFLAQRSKALPVYLPELDHYLLAIPEQDPENIQSEFYWER